MKIKTKKPKWQQKWDANFTSVKISKINRTRLREYGKMGDSYDSVITKLLDEKETPKSKFYSPDKK